MLEARNGKMSKRNLGTNRLEIFGGVRLMSEGILQGFKLQARYVFKSVQATLYHIDLSVYYCFFKPTKFILKLE